MTLRSKVAPLALKVTRAPQLRIELYCHICWPDGQLSLRVQQ